MTSYDRCDTDTDENLPWNIKILPPLTPTLSRQGRGAISTMGDEWGEGGLKKVTL